MYTNAQDYEEEQIAKMTNSIDGYIGYSRTGGSNINYSTTEQDTGLKWIDGKKIYQKTIIKNNVNKGDIQISATELNIDQCINVDGCHNGSYQSDMNDYQDFNYAIFAWYNKEENMIFIRNNSSNIDISVFLTIQYTKTTD